MEILMIILAVIFLIAVPLNIVLFAVVLSNVIVDEKNMDSCIVNPNPKVIYKNLHVNWFGTMLLTIIFNILLPVISIPYWICKLCTIGRK